MSLEPLEKAVKHFTVTIRFLWEYSWEYLCDVRISNGYCPLDKFNSILKQFIFSVHGQILEIECLKKQKFYNVTLSFCLTLFRI